MSDTASLLEDAANRIEDISTRDLQIMLRRAALVVRNARSIALDADMEDAVRSLCSEIGLTREHTIRYVVREWMEKNTYLPVRELEKDSDVDGEA